MFYSRSVRMALVITFCLLLSETGTRSNTEEIGETEFSFPETGVRVAGQAVLLAIENVSAPLKNRWIP